LELSALLRRTITIAPERAKINPTFDIPSHFDGCEGIYETAGNPA